MQCPKDRQPCEQIQLQDVTVDVCPSCQGVWLDQVEVPRLTQHFSVPTFSRVDELLAVWQVQVDTGTAPKDFWVEDTLVCPRDGQQMQKHYFAGSRIGVDQCPGCQVFWLDGGELQAVAEYFKPNHELEQAWRMAFRDQKKLQEEFKKVANIPATIATWAATPFLPLAAIGALVLKTILDRVIAEDVAAHERFPWGELR